MQVDFLKNGAVETIVSFNGFTAVEFEGTETVLFEVEAAEV